jgi:hypothetical protein
MDEHILLRLVNHIREGQGQHGGLHFELEAGICAGAQALQTLASSRLFSISVVMLGTCAGSG